MEPIKLPITGLLIGKSYDMELRKSVSYLLDEFRGNAPDLSRFVAKFYELMQAQIDPPLESIWFYSALTFRSWKDENKNPSRRVSMVTDLFQFITSCSSPCSSLKSIALLAPVVLEGYRLATELLSQDLVSKRGKKTVKAVQSLVDTITGHINMCCYVGLKEEECSNLIVGFKDLILVWIDGDGEESFFPLVSRDIIYREIGDEGCDTEGLATVVILQAFLLKLCLSLQLMSEGIEVEEELRNWVVTSINGFRSISVFDNLVKVLLYETLPKTTLLSSENEYLLRRILYDAIVLVEYSFLHPDQLEEQHMKSLSLSRLIITQKAIEFFRKHGDQKRAISYSSSFANSQLPSQIIKWVTIQTGTHEEPNGSSPKSFIKWLVDLGDQGMQIFDDFLVHHAKLVVGNSEPEYNLPALELEGKKVNEELIFYVDKGEDLTRDEDEDEDEEKEEEEEGQLNESMSAAFVAAAHTLKLTESSKSKRKEMRSCEKKKKRIRYQFDGISDNDANSESEVEDPISDEES